MLVNGHVALNVTGFDPLEDCLQILLPDRGPADQVAHEPCRHAAPLRRRGDGCRRRAVAFSLTSEKKSRGRLPYVG